jgi:hypothetical protein
MSKKVKKKKSIFFYKLRLPGKTAGQACRARLPGKTAGQDCWARLPGKTTGQDCRASLNKSQQVSTSLIKS